MPYRLEQYWLATGGVPACLGVWPRKVGILRGDGSYSHEGVQDLFCINCVTAGRICLTHAGQEMQIGQGEMFTLWPGCEYVLREEPAAPATFRFVQIDGPLAAEFACDCGLTSQMPAVRLRDLPGANSLLKQILAHYRAQTLEKVQESAGLLLRLPLCCGLLELRQGKRASVTEIAAGIIAAQINEGINVNGLCAALNVSRTTLHRKFQECFGESPLQYIERVRLQRVQFLLRTTSHPVVKVARLTGFATDIQLHRWFKRLDGKTPLEYRQNPGL